MSFEKINHAQNDKGAASCFLSQRRSSVRKGFCRRLHLWPRAFETRRANAKDAPPRVPHVGFRQSRRCYVELEVSLRKRKPGVGATCHDGAMWNWKTTLYIIKGCFRSVTTVLCGIGSFVWAWVWVRGVQGHDGAMWNWKGFNQLV